MKTSISLPDHLFRLAEAAARKLKMSRSQLYATALAEYLERRQTSKITERLNAIYSAEPSKLDSALDSAQIESPWFDRKFPAIEYSSAKRTSFS